jgi:ribosome biogenesis GTPase
MKISHTKPGKLDGTEREGLLIACAGAHAEIEDEFGKVVYCHIRKNLETVITGDHILWQPEHDDSGVIVGNLPRKSLLAHPGKHGKSKPVAANIDAIIIVGAAATFSEYLLDRYLIAAENLQIPPLILLNKVDLLDDMHLAEMQARLSIYENAGYQVIYSSVHTKHGLTDLEHFLRDKTCVLVGTSGVGKSSLIRNFIPEQHILVGETSAKGIGRHTTTGTRLYHLPLGGNLIDSPGVREFGLWNATHQEILNGFVEFQKYLGHCKFRDCKHYKEPACALKKAVADKEVSLIRFESYQKMVGNE